MFARLYSSYTLVFRLNFFVRFENWGRPFCHGHWFLLAG